MWRGNGVDWSHSRDLSDGVQLLQAWFAGHGYDKHRHDTYAIGLTDAGVQAFDYRGRAEVSTPGKVVVRDPDQPAAAPARARRAVPALTSPPPPRPPSRGRASRPGGPPALSPPGPSR